MTQTAPVLSADGSLLLHLWQQGLAVAGPKRADAVLRAWREQPAAPATLGERNSRLLELHTSLFGADLPLLSQCPSCGSKAEFSADCVALSGGIPGGAPPRHRLERDGYAIEFRLPDNGDLAEASDSHDEDGFVAALLERCILASAHDGFPIAIDRLPPALLDALSQQMETLDPGARIAFAVRCPQCDTDWTAGLDLGQLVWSKVQATAERLLIEIDALARAYGWTEREVLELSPLRRAAYLQLVSG